MVEVNGSGLITTTHCVSSVIKPGDKQSIHDPLQFVKIKTTELSQKAKEQIKLAEEVKITKEKIKEVEEEWQNNLLNWKSKRKQSKRNSEDEMEDRNSINNSRKIKTFNEILNEKKKQGHRIGYNLHHYLMNEDDENLIDQSTTSTASSTTDQTDQTDQTDYLTLNQQLDDRSNEQRSAYELNNQKNENFNSQQETNFNRYTEEVNQNDSSDDVQNQDQSREYNSTNLSQNEIAQTNQFKNMYCASKDESGRRSNRLNDSQTSINSTNSSIATRPNHLRSNKITEIGQQLTNSSIANNTHKDLDTFKRTKTNSIGTNSLDGDDTQSIEQDETKKLSFKAKLSAFENLTKVEPKKPIEKTPPVKNKLRMSSSNNLISDKRSMDEQTNQVDESNFSRRFTSKSNENLSKFDKSTNQQQQQNKDVNIRLNRNEPNSTKSESNLNVVDSNQYEKYENIQKIETTQSDYQLNNELNNELNNQNLSTQNELLDNKSELPNTRSSNEAIPNKDNNNIKNIQQQFDCDFEVSQLSKRMQHQLSTSPNHTHQTSTTQQLNTHSTNQSIHQTLHASSQPTIGPMIAASIQQTLNSQPYMNSMELNSNPMINQTTNNFFNDDYANAQIYNQHQSTSHNLIKNLPQHMQNSNSIPDFTIDPNQQQILNSQQQSSNNHLYQSAVTKQQSLSTSILPQQQTGVFYEDNIGIYGNYHNVDQPSTTSLNGANVYQLQKHNVSKTLF